MCCEFGASSVLLPRKEVHPATSSRTSAACSPRQPRRCQGRTCTTLPCLVRMSSPRTNIRGGGKTRWQSAPPSLAQEWRTRRTSSACAGQRCAYETRRQHAPLSSVSPWWMRRTGNMCTKKSIMSLINR